MDADERAAIVDEGYDPDDPAVVAAMAAVQQLVQQMVRTRRVSGALDRAPDLASELLLYARGGATEFDRFRH